jgi:hypothetical protein
VPVDRLADREQRPRRLLVLRHHQGTLVGELGGALDQQPLGGRREADLAGFADDRPLRLPPVPLPLDRLDEPELLGFRDERHQLPPLVDDLGAVLEEERPVTG